MSDRDRRRRYPELSDLIVDFTATERLPVRAADVIATLEADGHRRSAKLAATIRQRGEFFDEADADAVLLRSHLELQRLAEEIQHGQRVTRLLRPLVDMLDGPVTIVDVGCGLGYLVRWFAATRSLGADTRVIGVDFNRTLLDAARALADAEQLDCEFVAGDAFALDQAATVYISSGVIHHFTSDDLADFFAAQERAGASGCFHFDVAPTAITPFGAWLFHRARMREPLARHDGVHSALRAHDDDVLVDAVRAGATGWTPLLFDAVGRRMAVLNVMRPIIGLRPELVDAYERELGPLATRLSRP